MRYDQENSDAASATSGLDETAKREIVGLPPGSV
jgi:hypothetical protein